MKLQYPGYFVVCDDCHKWAENRGWLERYGIGRCKCGGNVRLRAVHPGMDTRK